jgi:hypothetical protein
MTFAITHSLLFLFYVTHWKMFIAQAKLRSKNSKSSDDEKQNCYFAMYHLLKTFCVQSKITF